MNQTPQALYFLRRRGRAVASGAWPRVGGAGYDEGVGRTEEQQRSSSRLFRRWRSYFGLLARFRDLQRGLCRLVDPEIAAACAVWYSRCRKSGVE